MKKTINFFLVLLFLLVPFGALLRIKLFTNVYLLPQDILVFVVSFFVVLHFILEKKIPRNIKTGLFLLLFVLVGSISAFFNLFLIPKYDIFVALLYGARYLSYIPLLFIGEIGTNYKKWLYISGGMTVVFGFAQYLFYNNLANLTYLGWDNHLYRLFSTFLDPNFAGAFYVILFFFTIPQVVDGFKAGKKNTFLYALLSVAALLSIYLTYSRTSFIMLLAGIIVLFLSIRKIKLLLIAAILAFAFFFLFSDVKIEGLNPFRTVSSIERIKSAKGAFEIIQKNPIVGVGFNGYRYAQVHYGLRTQEGARISNADAGTDNSYLFVLATAGITGFVFFLLAYFYLLKLVFEKSDILHVAARSIIVVSLVGCLFLNILFYTPILLWMYLIVGEVKENK